jgi:hypothetical protein
MFKIIIFLNLFFLLLHSESIYSNDNCTVADADAANKVLSFLNDNSVQLSFFSSIKSDAYKQKFVELFEDMARHNKLDEFKDLIFQEKSLKVKQYFDTIVELEKKTDADRVDSFFKAKISSCKSGTFNPSDCKRFVGDPRKGRAEGQDCNKKEGLYLCVKMAYKKAIEQRNQISDGDKSLYDFLLDSEIEKHISNIRNGDDKPIGLPSFQTRFRKTQQDIDNFDHSTWTHQDQFKNNRNHNIPVLSTIKPVLPGLSGRSSPYLEYDIGILPGVSTDRGITRLVYNPQDKTMWLTGDHYDSFRFIGCKPSDCTKNTIDALRRKCRSRQLPCEVP